MASACLLLALAGLALAQTDITADDWFQKDQIAYDPPAAWLAASISDRYAQTSTFSNATGASATFKFTGTGIQYMGYADFLPANTTNNLVVILDGQTIPIPGNLGIDHPNQQILFSKQGLENGPHTIVVKKVGTQVSGADINIDAFIYRILDNSPTQTQGGQQTGTSDSGGANVGAIAGGVVGGVAAGGIVAFLVWYILRKRRAEKDVATVEATSQHFNPYAPHPNALSRTDMASVNTGLVDPTTMPGYGSYSTVPNPYPVANGGAASTYSSHSKSGHINAIIASPPLMQVFPSPQSPGSSSGQGSVYHQLSFSVSSNGQSGSHGPSASVDHGAAPAVPPLRQLPVPPTPSEETGPNRIMSPQPPPPYAPS